VLSIYGGTTGRHVARTRATFAATKVLHKQGVVLTVATAQIPHVPEEHMSIQPSDTTCFNVRVQYGSWRTRTSPCATRPRARDEVGSYRSDAGGSPTLKKTPDASYTAIRGTGGDSSAINGRGTIREQFAPEHRV